MKKKYRVGIYEETAGYIVIEAESAQQAKEVGDELLNEYGCDKLFWSKLKMLHVLDLLAS